MRDRHLQILLVVLALLACACDDDGGGTTEELDAADTARVADGQDDVLDTSPDAATDTDPGDDTTGVTDTHDDGETHEEVDTVRPGDAVDAVDTAPTDASDGDIVPLPAPEAWDFWPPITRVEGGEVVTVRGDHFDAAVEVWLDGVAVAQVDVLDANTLTFVAPAIEPGGHEVAVARDGQADVFPWPLVSYMPPGPSGGPIADTVEVVVSTSGLQPLADAFVMLGTDPSTPHQGFTDADGRITFTGLSGGPVTVVAAAVGKASFMVVDVDAQRVAIRMEPRQLQPPPPDPAFPDPAPAEVSGTLTGVDQLTTPGADERREVLVWSSRRGALTTSRANTTVDELGVDGMYQVMTRPGEQALVAVGGLYDPMSQQFVPERMGLVRGVVFEPGEVAQHDLTLDIPLTESLTIEMAELATDLGGDSAAYEASAALSLGHEGLVHPFDTQRSTPPFAGESTSTSVTVSSLPALDGELADASMDVAVSLVVPTATGTLVLGRALQHGLTDLSLPLSLSMPARPTITTPVADSVFAGQVEFTVEGTGEPDMFSISLQSTGFPSEQLWSVIAPGGTRAVTFPTFPDFSGQPPERQPAPWPAGAAAELVVVGVALSNFDYHDMGSPGEPAVEQLGYMAAPPVSLTF